MAVANYITMGMTNCDHLNKHTELCTVQAKNRKQEKIEQKKHICRQPLPPLTVMCFLPTKFNSTMSYSQSKVSEKGNTKVY